MLLSTGSNEIQQLRRNSSLGRIFDAFGFDRCMWGTDWTRAVNLLSYEQGVEAFRVTDRLSDSEKAALMGETLTGIYNWSPKRS
jgi:predicted TIM-barrel fold metal-dependent hydrolase